MSPELDRLDPRIDTPNLDARLDLVQEYLPLAGPRRPLPVFGGEIHKTPKLFGPLDVCRVILGKIHVGIYEIRGFKESSTYWNYMLAGSLDELLITSPG